MNVNQLARSEKDIRELLKMIRNARREGTIAGLRSAISILQSNPDMDIRTKHNLHAIRILMRSHETQKKELIQPVAPKTDVD